MRKIVLISLVAAGLAAATAWAATTPSVSTGGATGVSRTGAMLHGTVNPGGSPTTYSFQYGPTTAYGLTSETGSAGHGTSAVSVLGAISGLQPGTLYHYRIAAVNSVGSALGTDRSLTTGGHPLPGAVTAPPVAVGNTVATLEGTVVTQGVTTYSYFQYGTTPNYGEQTATADVTAATTPTGVAYTLTGLAPGTTFHYRLVASHTGFAPEYGADVAFTTTPLERWRSRVTARTVPGRARHAPYLFTTLGAVVPEIALPPGVGCSGIVRVSYLAGRRTVAVRSAAVNSNCAYEAGVGFRHLIDRSRHRLTVKVRFRGNAYLKPAKSRAGHVWLG